MTGTMNDESERRAALLAARPPLSPNPFDGHHPFVWSEWEIDRLRLAFKYRFNEPLPRTETLMAVAAEGMRILLEHKAEANGGSND